MAKEIKGITIEIGGNTKGLQSAISDANAETRKLTKELKTVEKALKLDPGNTDLLRQKQQLLAESIAETSKKLEALKEMQKQAKEQGDKDGVGDEQYRKLQREIAYTEKSLKDLTKESKEFGSVFTQKLEQVGHKLEETGEKIKSAGTKMSKVSTAIIGTGVAATKMASDFEDSIAKVSTLADTSQVSMGELKDGIKDISRETGIAATEISGSVYDALSSGVETANVLDYVKSNVLLTKAGFTDMGTAVDVTTTVMNAYGEKAFEVSQIGDMLVKTQDLGKISVDELGKNMGRVIPTASSLGVNLDQLGASYAILTAKGQNANIATTNLNSLLGELGKTGSKSDEALRSVAGKSFKELIDSGKTVGDVLAILDQHAKDTDVSLSDLFGSTTAKSAALTLLSDGVDAFNESVDEMNSSAGTMEENYEKLLTPSEKLANALNDLKLNLLDLGEAGLPIIEMVAEKIKEWSEKFRELDDNTKNTILTIVAIVAAVGPVLIVVGQVVSAVGSLMTVIKPMATAIGALASPVGMIVIALGTFVAVLVTLYKTNDEFKEKVDAAWRFLSQTIPEKIKGIVASLVEFGNNLKAWASELPAKLSELPGQFATAGKDAINGLIEGFKEKIEDAKNAVKNVASNVLTAFKDKLGIHSPSRVMRDEVGKQITAGIAEGILAEQRTLNKSINSLSIKAIATAKAEAKDYKEIGELYAAAMKEGVETKSEDAINAITGLVNKNVATLVEKNKKAKTEYEKAGKEIIDAYKSAILNGAKDIQSKISDEIARITKEAQEQYDAIIQSKEAMESKLAGFGELYLIDPETNEVVINSIDEQITAIERYSKALDKLKEKGIDADLLGQVAGMGVEEGAGFGEALLSLSDEQFETYQNKWKEKQELAKQIAAEFYQDQLETLEADFVLKLDESLMSVPGTVETVGINSIEGMIKGMDSKKSAAVGKAREIADAIIAEMQRAMDIHSPSRKMRDLIGKNAIQGLILGIDAKIPELKAKMQDVSKVITNTSTSINNNNNSINLHIERVDNGNGRTIKDMATELAFYRRQKEVTA